MFGNIWNPPFTAVYTMFEFPAMKYIRFLNQMNKNTELIINKVVI